MRITEECKQCMIRRKLNAYPQFADQKEVAIFFSYYDEEVSE